MLRFRLTVSIKRFDILATMLDNVLLQRTTLRGISEHFNCHYKHMDLVDMIFLQTRKVGPRVATSALKFITFANQKPLFACGSFCVHVLRCSLNFCRDGFVDSRRSRRRMLGRMCPPTTTLVGDVFSARPTLWNISGMRYSMALKL